MDALKVLEIMFTSFPNAQVSEKLMANYLRHLSDIPVEELQRAADACVVECKFIPTIADILERVPERYRKQRQGEWRAAGQLTVDEINELPAPARRLYRDPRDVPGPEGRRYRMLQMRTPGGDDRGH